MNKKNDINEKFNQLVNSANGDSDNSSENPAPPKKTLPPLNSNIKKAEEPPTNRIPAQNNANKKPVQQNNVQKPIQQTGQSGQPTNQPQRPRKRVTKKVLRRRQFTALAIIALIVLIFVILVAKACSKDSSDGGNTKTSQTTTTTTFETATTAETEPTEPPTTTTTAPASTADPSLSAQVEISEREVLLDVGEEDMPLVYSYPDGSGEENEVWTSTDPSVATVNGYGNITAVAPGTCYVILTLDNAPGVEVQIRVTVAEGISEENEESGDEDELSPDSELTNSGVAVAPPVENIEGLHYFNDILVVNKSYSLPATYNPGLNPLCSQQFKALSDAAAKEGLSIWIGSGFRSYNDQVIIYNNYSDMYGQEAADTFSARPGYSEHQTGLVIDCNTIDDAFGETAEAAWLAEHAHEYGFIIRYPKGKEIITGYQYEPWHIRYVGEEAATEMYNTNKCLEEYLKIDSYYH